MENEIVCYLSSKKVDTNKSEYRYVNQITCPEFNLSFSGDGDNVKKMIEALRENKCDINRVLSVYRGDTLVFKKFPLKQWLFTEDRRPEWLKPKGSR